jgi:hypothetical protein
MKTRVRRSYATERQTREWQNEVPSHAATDGYFLAFSAACEAARRAMGTRKGEQLT